MRIKVKTAALGLRPAKPTASNISIVPTGWTALCGLCAVLLVFSARGNTLTWSGDGAPSNANWNDSVNWGGVGVPGNGDTIVFSGSHTNAFVNTNNIANLSLNQIQFVGDLTSGAMFDLRGQPFTLTGSILATNVTGTNIIENNITLANANVLMVVSNNDQLIIEGILSGPGGVTKAGAGTLTYQCDDSNTYTNTTLVNGGVLQFNVAFTHAVSGPLVIGDGTGDYAATVEDLQGSEMYGGPAVTINTSGLLNLSNCDEPSFSTNLTMNDGEITTGNGVLTLQPNTTFTVNSYPSIYGNLNLNGGQLTLQGDAYLDFYATVGGTGNILQTENVTTSWFGANTYSGNYTAEGSGYILLVNSQALGNANNTLTLNGTAWVFLDGDVNVTNQSLTINSTYSPIILIPAVQTNSWKSSFIFNTPCTIDVGTSSALTLNGPISGNGSVTKTDAGRLAYTGSSANTYGGATTVDGGLLQLGKAFSTTAVPGPLFIGANATVRLLNGFQINNPDISVTLSNASLFDLAGNGDWVGPISLQGAQITSGTATLFFSGNIIVNPSTVAQSIISGNAVIWNGTYMITNTGHHFSPDLTISANVSSEGPGDGLTKDGAGEVSLSGNNTFTGPVTVNNGDLWAQTSTALGSTNYTATVNDGGTLFLYGSGLDFGLKPLVLNGTGYAFGALSCQGSSVWPGGVTLNTDSTVYVFTNSSLTFSGAISGAGGYRMYGPGTNVFSGSLANTYAGTTTVNNGTLLLNKPSGSAVPGNLVINSPGTVRLANIYQTEYTADVLVNGGGLFDLSTYYTYVNTLRGTGTVNFGAGGWIYIGLNDGSSEFDGSFIGTGYAPGFTVGKTGTGTFTIGGNSSYTAGNTRVVQGELVVNGYQGAIPVTVVAGAALGGSGTVGEITANGTVEPGGPGLNTGLLGSGDVTFSSTGNFTVELTGTNAGAGPAGYDELDANGTIGTNTLANATLTVIPAFTTPVVVGQQFVILTSILSGPPCCTVYDVVSGTFKGLSAGTIFQVDGIGFQISYPAYQVVLTVTSLPAKPVITGIQRTGGGLFQLTGIGSTNLTYSVWAATNLTTTNWMTIGSVTVPANTNVFQFTDSNMLYYADRFYRFTWP